MTSNTLDNTTEDGSWWRRPAGGREVLTIAMPLVVSMLSVTLMTFVDRMFLNWHSSTAMAAAFSGSIAWWASLCLPMGICSYANTFVSQYFGDGQRERIGVSVWQGVWVGVIATPIMLAFVPLAPWIFELAEHGEEAAMQETIYMQILCVGTSAMLISTALSSFYGGMGRTWVVMMVYVCALKGAGDTHYIMNVSIVMAIVLAGLSWLVVDVLKADIYVCWTIVIGWVWVMGTTFFLRYRTGKWRAMRVIETDHEPTLHEDPVDTETPEVEPAAAIVPE